MVSENDPLLVEYFMLEIIICSQMSKSVCPITEWSSGQLYREETKRLSDTISKHQTTS